MKAGRTIFKIYFESLGGKLTRRRVVETYVAVQFPHGARF